jgi:hypothetical protein
LIAKDEIDAQGYGDGVYPQDLVNVDLQFFLLKIFLKGVAPGDDAVAVEELIIRLLGPPVERYYHPSG